jgi:hypothetical protein
MSHTRRSVNDTECFKIRYIAFSSFFLSCTLTVTFKVNHSVNAHSPVRNSAFISNASFPKTRSLDSAVGIATGYGLDDQGVGVRVPIGERIFSYPSSPDRLWRPPNLLSNGYRWLFPGGKAAEA